MAKVSIVIPVYNGANYLHEAIDSALAQTYKDIEIIVVNDGSTDNGATKNIALSYGEQIRYFEKENGGVSTALNMGIDNMCGEYFSWLSHDDLYLPDKIEQNLAAIKDNPTQIVYSDYANVNEDLTLIGIVSAQKLHRSADHGFGLFPIITGMMHGCTLLIHRSQFEKYGKFDEDLRTTQDYDLFFKMFRGQRLAYIPKALVKGRVHPKRTTYTSDKTIPECENLWINMFQSLTREEICTIGRSKWHFWLSQAPFMKEYTPYAKATEFAYTQLKATIDELNGGLVSIITPFYNRIPLVLQCIECVQQQSYSNWELILINDGSKDDISEIEAYVKTDNRIKLISYEHNKGVSHARNKGLDAATGKFVAFLDSDDRWAPQKLENQLRFMLENQYCVSHTDYARVDSEGNLWEKMELSELSGDVFSRCIFSCGIDTSCVVAEREYWGNLRFPSDIDYGEDVCIWLELAWRGKWGHVAETLTFFYVREDSAFISQYKQQLGYAEILRYILKRPQWTEYQREINIAVKDLEKLFTRVAAGQNANLEKEVDIDKISVIIPFYNRIECTIEAIQSVLAQTYTNYEILLIDDGSTEPLEDILSLVEDHPCITLITNDSNKGVSFSRNLGIDYATGGYIAFLDSDDLFLPEKLERQRSCLHESDAVMSQTPYIRRKKGTNDTIIDTSYLQGMVAERLAVMCPIATPTVMIKRDFLMQSGLRLHEDVRYGEDTIFWLEILKNHQIVSLSDALTIVNVGETSSSNSAAKQVEGLQCIIQYVLSDNFYQTCDKAIVNLMTIYLDAYSELEQNRKKQNRSKLPLPARPIEVYYTLIRIVETRFPRLHRFLVEHFKRKKNEPISTDMETKVD